jgi:Sec-independent protein translocase protein TatA
VLALIGNLDTAELVIVMVVAVLIFGKQLPQVAAQAGSQLVKLRRSLDAAWRETGMDDEIRNVKRDFDNAIPRDLSLGDMAKIASVEMDKRIRKNEEDLAAEKAKDAPVETAGTDVATEPAATDAATEPATTDVAFETRATDVALDPAATEPAPAAEPAAVPSSLKPMPPPAPPVVAPWEASDEPPV